MVEAVWPQNDKVPWLSPLMFRESAREKAIPHSQSAGTDCWVSCFLAGPHITVVLPLALLPHMCCKRHMKGWKTTSTVAPCSFRILHGKEHELKEHSLGFILFLPLSDGNHNAVCTFSVLAISLWKTDHNITSFLTPWSEIREYLKLFNTVLGSLHKFDEYHLRRPRIFICRPNKTNLCIWFLYRSSRSTKS